jgi:hypothetical protein
VVSTILRESRYSEATGFMRANTSIALKCLLHSVPYLVMHAVLLGCHNCVNVSLVIAFSHARTTYCPQALTPFMPYSALCAFSDIQPLIHCTCTQTTGTSTSSAVAVVARSEVFSGTVTAAHRISGASLGQCTRQSGSFAASVWMIIDRSRSFRPFNSMYGQFHPDN